MIFHQNIQSINSNHVLLLKFINDTNNNIETCNQLIAGYEYEYIKADRRAGGVAMFYKTI